VALVILGNLALAGGGADREASQVSTDYSSPSRAPLASTEPVTTITRARPTADPAAGAPSALSVPRLRIEAGVLPIQVEGGILEPPGNPRQVGWDTETALPGAAYGSAVITGHTVHTGGGALDELDDLKAGDTVLVTTAKGRIGYTVSQVTKITKQDMVGRIPSLFLRDVPGRLVLITCTDWNGSEYLGNSVVLADPVTRS
jgi:LPXTG-site transpeptidase (sortase) family protein